MAVMTKGWEVCVVMPLQYRVLNGVQTIEPGQRATGMRTTCVLMMMAGCRCDQVGATASLR